MPPSANEVFRDFVRFTGDGLPNEPVGHPLPIGDPRSGVHNPKKADIREVFVGADLARDEAEAARDAAVAASADVQGATLYAANLPALLANTAPSYTVGTVFGTRAEGYSFEVVATGGDHVTAGGVQLKAVWRGQSSDLLASGIDTTGAADAAPLLNAYMAARPGLVVTVPPGNYRLDSTVDVPSDTNLDLRNCTFNLSNLATGQPAFRAAGTQDAYVTMSARPVTVRYSPRYPATRPMRAQAEWRAAA